MEAPMLFSWFFSVTRPCWNGFTRGVWTGSELCSGPTLFWINKLKKFNDKGYVKNKNKIKNIKIKSKCDSAARVRPPPPTERVVARLHGLKKDEIRWVTQPSIGVGSSHHWIVRWGEIDDPRSELLFPIAILDYSYVF
jgi:hypothetical protein